MVVYDRKRKKKL